MSNLTQQQKNKIFETFANSDLRSARKEGKIALINTKHGTLEVSYNTEDKTYSITSFHGGSHIIAGKAKVAREFIAANYTESEL